MSQLQRSPNPHFGPDCPQLENIRSDPNSHQYWIKDCLPVFVDGNHQKGFLQEGLSTAVQISQACGLSVKNCPGWFLKFKGPRIMVNPCGSNRE